jgi:zinc transporter 1/2/3
VIGIKLALSAAVLAAGLAGGALPLWRGGDPSGGRLLGWGNALAAGVFLGAGMIHMLPDAAEGWHSLLIDYPMAYLLAAAAFVLMLLFEHVLPSESAHEAMHAHSGERFEALHQHGPPADGRASAYAVLTALSIHAFLAGIALGAQPELSAALVIFVAIMAHKTTAGFALGVSLARSPLPRRRALWLLALFALATPAGILVGALVDEVLEGRSPLPRAGGGHIHLRRHLRHPAGRVPGRRQPPGQVAARDHGCWADGRARDLGLISIQRANA